MNTVNYDDLKIDHKTIKNLIYNFNKSHKFNFNKSEEFGHVLRLYDGIAYVSGLPSLMNGELLSFENNTLGLVQNLDITESGVIILGNFNEIKEGQKVFKTNKIFSIPVGNAYLGRTVNALGLPIDGLGKIECLENRILELKAPDVMDRSPVSEPLETGIKAIDTMIPIGRGQRQLIIGDRKTGKTSLALDMIINQKFNWNSSDIDKKNNRVICIYVAIGQKASTISEIQFILKKNDALRYTTIIASPASDPAGLKYLSPYSGSTIGQHWMYKGKHVLIIFDDLSKQAEAYRSISLLLRKPPGREAYPGDIFYLHSRLLERCAKLSKDLGGGSMTGIPIVETKSNDIGAFIPTNVISITDGQIFLRSDLFNANQRPAIDVGISVSRVGGAAQINSIKKISGTLKLNLAQYKDMQAFSAFMSDLDDISKNQLIRGEKLTEILKQNRYSLFSIESQVISIWSAINGYLDNISTDYIHKFEIKFLNYLNKNTKIMQNLFVSKDLSQSIIKELHNEIKKFKIYFTKNYYNKSLSMDHCRLDSKFDSIKTRQKLSKINQEKIFKPVE